MFVYVQEMDKYFLGETLQNYSFANDFCSSLGTTSASIHSDQDFYKTRLQCQSFGYIISNRFGDDDLTSCWIGMDDLVTEGTWKWVDGSTSDYGFYNNNPSQPTTGIFPWWGINPNNLANQEHCTELTRIWNKDYLWNDRPCNLTMMPLCNKIEDPIYECLNTGHNIHAWYDGSSIDLKYNLWIDKSGNNNIGVIINNTGIELFDGTNTTNSELYLNGEEIIIGTYQTEIIFNLELNPINHTIFNLAKYRDFDGAIKQRIVQSDYQNLFVGFWMGLSGVGHENYFLTTQEDHFGTEWVLSTQQRQLYRGNFIDLTVNGASGLMTNIHKLVINTGYHAHEASDFAMAELIVFNNNLDITEIECIENYLQNKYIFIPTTSPTSDPTKSPTKDPTNDPTTNPSISPSFQPTLAPSLSPSIAPTTSPSLTPTLAPSQSPTTCYDGTTFTNDGYEPSIIDIMSGLMFNINITDNDKIVIANSIGKYWDSKSELQFSNDNKQELRCLESVSCLGSNIVFKDNSICNLYCSGYGACRATTVSIHNCQRAHIICDGSYTCDEMIINASANILSADLIIDCGHNTSCTDMYIEIGEKLYSNISCYDINSCDRMIIEIDSDNYANNFLYMYSYSMNITFNNGFGYQEAGSTPYVKCNELNHFIKYNSSNIADLQNTNIDDNQLKVLIEEEYLNDIFPCQGITIECFTETDTNISTVTSCDMNYAIDTSSLAINQSLSDPDLSATCYWIPVSDVIEIQCRGNCETSPTKAPTHKPTQNPTETTQSPTKDPTMDPTSDPTIDPTSDPTTDPTNDPTVDPTMEPTFNPTTDPTKDPTIEPTTNPTNAPSYSPSTAPTNPPTIAPSGSPSAPPTVAPTFPPSISPSLAPSISPSITPTFSPSQSPTIPPTPAPSFSPSQSPSDTPTDEPTNAPTRLPTKDVDDIYDTYIPIQYKCHNLTEENKYYMVDYTQNAKIAIQEIIERNYLDIDNAIYYEDYWLNIYQINGKNVSFTRVSTDANNDDDDSVLTLYDLDILGNTPMILTARIECADNIADSLIRKSGLLSFTNDIQTKLRDLFNNTKLVFNVDISGTLSAFKKFPVTTSEPESEEPDEDNTALYISIVVMVSASIVSAGAFSFNKMNYTKVDNAAFYTPILVALGIYDFISDINLSIQIFYHQDLIINITNIIFLLGILSVVFIILPFISNLWYAMRINKQKTIRHNPSARAWFAKHLAQFILLCVLCAGTYPILGLISSRLFGLDFFNAGLMSSDLHQLSKIKIRSTIFMENLPQLLIQIIYTAVIGEAENATILAFIASSLSVIASVVIYQAQKEQNEDIIVTKYYIRFTDYKNSKILDKYYANIKFRKGLKMELGEKLCTVFNLPNKSIEIGFVTPNVRGCIIHVQHSIFKKELDEHRDKIFALQLGEMNQGLIFNVTPDLFAESIYDLHRFAVTQVLKDHFQIDDDNFIATYHKRHEDATKDPDNNNNNKGGHNKASSLLLKQNVDNTEGLPLIGGGTGTKTKTKTRTESKQSNVINEMLKKMKRRQTEQLLSVGIEESQIELQAINTARDRDEFKYNAYDHDDNDNDDEKENFVKRNEFESLQSQMSQLVMLQKMILKNLDQDKDQK